MRNFLIAIILMTLSFSSYAQIELNDNLKIPHNNKTEAIISFIKHHKLDNALVTWYTSPWVNNYDVFYCLFNKDSKWTLVQIQSTAYPVRDFPYKLLISQKPLNKIQADSLYSVLMPDSAFKYKQADFDKLPNHCEYEINGKKRGLYSISDAATSFLIRYDGKETESLVYYAAYDYLKSCYPYVPMFGILKGFNNTTGRLYSTVYKSFNK